MEPILIALIIISLGLVYCLYLTLKALRETRARLYELRAYLYNRYLQQRPLSPFKLIMRLSDIISDL